ncbi:putative elongator complex protein 1, partial [Coemansia sp. RSA 986]
MPTILTTFMCQTPANIASALQLLAPLSTDERDDALTYLLFLLDADTVYNAALGLSSLPLVLLVTQHSQRGPCKYLVSLDTLKAIRSKKHQHYNI